MTTTFAPLGNLPLLRVGTERTVSETVWATQLRLECASDVNVLNEHLRSVFDESKAGVIDSVVHFPVQVHEALSAVCDLVRAAVVDQGLLALEEAAQVRRNALLLAMRGAQPHMDLPRKNWTNKLFWALGLHDTDTDVLFGHLGLRVPLNAGTLLVFDPCQPHAVIAREHDQFMKSHFRKSRVQFCAGGDFPAKDWSVLGVSHKLAPQDLVQRRDVMQALVHQRTCLLRR